MALNPIREHRLVLLWKVLDDWVGSWLSLLLLFLELLLRKPAPVHLGPDVCVTLRGCLSKLSPQSWWHIRQVSAVYHADTLTIVDEVTWTHSVANRWTSERSASPVWTAPLWGGRTEGLTLSFWSRWILHRQRSGEGHFNSRAVIKKQNHCGSWQKRHCWGLRHEVRKVFRVFPLSRKHWWSFLIDCVH